MAQRQYEVTCSPAIGLKSADDAVKMREMARATAFRLGSRATFVPILDPNGTGNGVHIHFSFRDRDGHPATHDPAGAYGLTPTAQHFMAGVLDHLPAIAAVTAPSTVSYIRLRPNRWAPTFAYIADRDREASLRVCPVLALPGLSAERQFNVEYRVADAAASPYLALGALVFAGVDGIRRKLPLPEPRNVAAMSEAERIAAGIRHLPQSLGRSARRAGGNAGGQGMVRADLSRRLSPPQAGGDRHARRPRRGRAMPALRGNLLSDAGKADRPN